MSNEIQEKSLMDKFENVVGVEGRVCSYCSNRAKYAVKTNLGWKEFVCNLHLLQFGKVKTNV